MVTIAEARAVWANISDDAFDSLIWTCTPYPCSTAERAAEQLIELHARHGGSAEAAIDEAMKEFDDAWNEHKERTKIYGSDL